MSDLLKVLLEDTFWLAHSKENARHIWWYHVPSDKLEMADAEDAEGHLDKRFFSEEARKETKGWMKGRVFVSNGDKYLMIYASRFGNIPSDLLQKVTRTIMSAGVGRIDFVVDDNGRSIIDSVNHRS